MITIGGTVKAVSKVSAGSRNVVLKGRRCRALASRCLGY